ncbi:hypothetical protein UlMin_031250 [Ulmus minor]
MAAIKLYGSHISTATARVLACLYEKELDFQFVPVDLSTGEHKKEPFLSKNPFGLLPAFEDGDLELFESRAITTYIAYQYANKGTELVYSDMKKQATALVWLEVEAQQFESASSKLLWEIMFKPMFGMTTDPAAAQEIEAKLEKVLDIYENRLSKSKYIGGESFTLADLHHLPNIGCLLTTSTKRLFESRPHVNAWIADITARPAWAKVLAFKNQA